MQAGSQLVPVTSKLHVVSWPILQQEATYLSTKCEYKNTLVLGEKIIKGIDAHALAEVFLSKSSKP